MNLPHLNKTGHVVSNNVPANTARDGIGPKTLRALSRPLTVNRGSRQTGLDLATDFLFDQTAPVPDPSASWRTLQTQRKNLLNLPYTQLAQVALDLSPEVNKGLHDFLRFVNPSYVIDNTNPRALEATNAFIRQLDIYYGSFSTHIDSMWSGIFLTGAVFPELVLAQGGRSPLDMVFNDANTARFRRERDAFRGPRWRLGQETRYGFNYLDDDPLVKYLGFDRLTDNPYGRPVVGPAVHSSVFLLGLIHDLRRVIEKMGMSRVDYELDAEELLKLIDRNPELAADDEATAQFINEHIDQVKNVLNNLDLDSDYVHLSTVNVNHATNPLTANMTGLRDVIDTLQRNIVNGFKGVSALLNILDSTTETHIRSQLEYFVSILQSLQDEIARMLADYFDIANQVQGIDGETTFLFRRQRTADKKATAEIEQIRTDTVINKAESLIITRDEARAEIDSFRNELEVSL